MFSIVIPTYKRDEDLEECLQSIRENSSDKNVEIIVLHSGFESTELICKKYNALSILDNARQNGKRVKSLWAIINDGIRMAKNDYVMYLNDDCLVLPEWDEIAGKYFEDDKTGLLILKTKGIGKIQEFRIGYEEDGLPVANYGIVNRKAKILFDEKFSWYYGDSDIPRQFLAFSDYSVKCTEENMIIHNHKEDDNRKENDSQTIQILKDTYRCRIKWAGYKYRNGSLSITNQFFRKIRIFLMKLSYFFKLSELRLRKLVRHLICK